MTPTSIDWVQVGRDAYANGEPAVPALNRQICHAISDLPVGGGAAEIMRQFTTGWHAANLADDTWRFQ